MTDGEKKRRGAFGEQAVCIKLEKSGYNILCRNYRRKCGEIDIIAENKDWIIFVEVKTRAGGSLIRGICAVDKKKKERLVRTAQLFLADNADIISGRQIRFDVAEVIVANSGENEPLKILGVNYFESAFVPGGLDIFLFI